MPILCGSGDTSKAAAEAAGGASGVLQQQLDHTEAHGSQRRCGRPLQRSCAECLEGAALFSTHASYIREIDAADAQIGHAVMRSVDAWKLNLLNCKCIATRCRKQCMSYST